LSFASPEKENYYIDIYAVITWEIFDKRAANHYYCVDTIAVAKHTLPCAAAGGVVTVSNPAREH
jgi:hypothetical protein